MSLHVRHLLVALVVALSIELGRWFPGGYRAGAGHFVLHALITFLVIDEVRLLLVEILAWERLLIPIGHLPHLIGVELIMRLLLHH